MLWVKSFHIISVICWFAVLFYLPRLFIYHAMSEDEISKERFKIMERKLIRAIGNPAMMATFIFGIWLITYNWQYYQNATWFWLKVGLIALLTIYYHICLRIWKQFREDQNTRSHTYYRWFNEVPALLLIGIVCLVVVKPPL